MAEIELHRTLTQGRGVKINKKSIKKMMLVSKKQLPLPLCSVYW
jgi:hypothetical protein